MVNCERARSAIEHTIHTEHTGSRYLLKENLPPHFKLESRRNNSLGKNHGRHLHLLRSVVSVLKTIQNEMSAHRSSKPPTESHSGDRKKLFSSIEENQNRKAREKIKQCPPKSNQINHHRPHRLRTVDKQAGV